MGVKVRERPNGSGVWWVFINHNGRRKAKRIGKHKTALDVAEKIKARLTLGEFKIEKKEPKVPTFKEYSKKWLALIEARRRETTHERYEIALRLHVLPRLGEKRLDEITRGDIRDLLLEKSKGLSQSSIELMRDVISGVFNYALDEDIIRVNPAMGITKRLQLDKRQAEIIPLTPTEQDTLLDTCKSLFPRHYPFLLFMARTGVRLGEALGVKWSDFDSESGFVWIKRAYRRGVYGLPKNGKPRRVKMSAQLRETMLELLRCQTEAGEVVFGEHGKPWEQNDVRRVFNKLLKEAGLRHVRIPDLRHTWVTTRLSLGHDLVEVSREAGHSSIKITADTYYHWLPDNAGDEMDQLDQVQPSATPAQPATPPDAHPPKFLQ